MCATNSNTLIRVRILALPVLTLAFAAHTGQAQTPAGPKTENAKVEQRTITGGLAQTIDSWAKAADHPQWLAYSVSAVSGDRQICCGDYHGDNGYCGPCHLEGSNHGSSVNLRSDKVELEGSRRLVVLLRADAHKIGKIRVASQDCTLDAGGLQVVWLAGANPAESVKFLETFVNGANFDDRGGEHLSRGALMAIALHGDPTADEALASFTSPDKPESIRKEAAFWAGEARGSSGFALLQRMAKQDPSTEVRAHVTFALSVSRESGALDEMIRMAHDDSSSHVRGQALFWLAQKAGRKAAGTITSAIENDPDTDVKKKAVFALSQMPKDEGVPKLIEVAQTNRNPEVRKQAMFWLGQSNDPRALDFFEKVLAK